MLNCLFSFSERNDSISFLFNIAVLRYYGFPYANALSFRYFISRARAVSWYTHVCYYIWLQRKCFVSGRRRLCMKRSNSALCWPSIPYICTYAPTGVCFLLHIAPPLPLRKDNCIFRCFNSISHCCERNFVVLF